MCGLVKEIQNHVFTGTVTLTLRRCFGKCNPHHGSDIVAIFDCEPYRSQFEDSACDSIKSFGTVESCTERLGN